MNKWREPSEAYWLGRFWPTSTLHVSCWFTSYAFHVDREKLTTHLVYLHTYLKHQHKLLQHIFCNFLKIKTIYMVSLIWMILENERFKFRTSSVRVNNLNQLNYDHYKNEYICEAKKWHILFDVFLFMDSQYM